MVGRRGAHLRRRWTIRARSCSAISPTTTGRTEWASWSNIRDTRASRDGSSPNPFRWDYTHFGKSDASGPDPDETIELLIVKHNAAANGFNLYVER